MKILKKIHDIFLFIPYYLRGLVVFAIIVLLSTFINKLIGRVDYWDTDIGKKQLEEIKRMANEKKNNTKNSDILEKIEVDTENNTVSGTVKENAKFGEFPKLKKEKDKTAFNDLKSDFVFGSLEAPITIIDYSSYSCPHCKEFYFNTMDNLMNNYIKTGKIKYVKRMVVQKETLLGVMLPYCINSGENRYKLIRDLYENTNDWTKGNRKEQVLKEIALRNGFTEESFYKCVKNKTLAQGLIDKQEAELSSESLFYVPTIFINGKRVGNGMSYKDLSEKIDEVINKNN
ncbi:MAG TPA: thioredoxin domain-containing protein [Rickettsiales bacterium]|nr:thioredoxin domain-containing protein [Rickettsiales bacterium]